MWVILGFLTTLMGTFWFSQCRQNLTTIPPSTPTHTYIGTQSSFNACMMRSSRGVRLIISSFSSPLPLISFFYVAPFQHLTCSVFSTAVSSGSCKGSGVFCHSEGQGLVVPNTCSHYLQLKPLVASSALFPTSPLTHKLQTHFPSLWHCSS